jgi:hypothetical protein
VRERRGEPYISPQNRLDPRTSASAADQRAVPIHSSRFCFVTYGPARLQTVFNVFLSSTFTDLERYRAKVRETIRRLGHADVCMETWGAQSGPTLDTGRQRIRARALSGLLFLDPPRSTSQARRTSAISGASSIASSWVLGDVFLHRLSRPSVIKNSDQWINDWGRRAPHETRGGSHG